MAVIDQQEDVVEEIIKDLKDVHNHIDQYKTKPKIAGHIDRVLGNVRDTGLLVVQKLDYLRTVKDKLEAFDLGLFKELNDKVQQLSEQNKVLVHEWLEEGHKRLFKKYNFDRLAARSIELSQALDRNLTEIERNLSSGKIDRAKKIVKDIIKDEWRVEHFLSKMKTLQDKVIKLTKKVLKIVKDMR